MYNSRIQSDTCHKIAVEIYCQVTEILGWQIDMDSSPPPLSHCVVKFSKDHAELCNSKL